MIDGVHAIVFSPAAESVRQFLSETLGFRSVDAGEGWLIFGLPPAELAVHPSERPSHELYLLCDDLDSTVEELARKGVQLARPITDQRWGRVTAIAMPDGSELGLYQPTHPRP